jgi:hypothetical protein
MEIRYLLMIIVQALLIAGVPASEIRSYPLD